MFQFHVGLLFIKFSLSNQTPKMMRILTLCRANAFTLPLKLIKSEKKTWKNFIAAPLIPNSSYSISRFRLHL